MKRVALAARLVVIAAIALSTRAQAAPSDEVPPALAKAYAYADGMIAAAHAGDLFENITYNDHPVTRHLLSGLECHFNGTPGERIAIFPSKLPRGDDVGCALQWRGFTTSLDVTRFPTPMTLDQATAMYVAEVTQAHPDAKPYTGNVATVQAREGQRAPFRTFRYVLSLDGHVVFSRLSVAVVDGWVIEERVSGPLDNPTLGDLLGDTQMMMAIDSVTK